MYLLIGVLSNLGIDSIITESQSLRLEMTSKIIESSCQPIITMPAKPCPEVIYVQVF